MFSSLYRSARRDRGASTIEYGLLVLAIAAVIVGVVYGFATIVQGAFSTPTDCLDSHGTSTSCPTNT